MRPAPRLLLALCGVASLLAACESAPVTGRSQMMLVSESEELRMGLQAYQQVLSKESLSYDAETNALVEKVGAYVGLGFKHLVFHAPGPDQERFLKLFADQVSPRLRKKFA